jgi:hypothetical protein
MTVEHLTIGQAIEPMPALCVASGFSRDCASGSSVHGIVMLFMDLYIFTKLCLDVLVIVNLHAGNQFYGVDVPGNAIFGGKMFSQKLHVLTIWTTSIPGNFLKGSVLHIHRHRSLRV